MLNKFYSMVHHHPLQDTSTVPTGFGQEQNNATTPGKASGPVAKQWESGVSISERN